MAEGARPYAGTRYGLLVWRERNENWEQVTHAFSDAVFDTIPGCAARPERVYAALAWEGVHRRDDGGQHRTRIIEGEVRAIATDPTDDNVIYVGTEPVHVYLSEDGGDRWEELTSLLALSEEVRKKWWTPYPPATGHVRYIFIHEDDPNSLAICLEHGGVAWSFDRGETWEDVSGGIDDLDMHMFRSFPHSRDRFSVSSAQGSYTSEDPADGWVRAESGLPQNYTHDFLLLDPARAGGAPSMLLSTANGSPGYWRGELRGATAARHRSLDQGTSWQRLPLGLPSDRVLRVAHD